MTCSIHFIHYQKQKQIDPLRSLAKGRPEVGAFRVFPPEYSAPANETPDGRVVPEEALRVERWGSCWNRYYALQVSFFMSSLASDVTQILTKNFLWMQTFCSTPMLEPEVRLCVYFLIYLYVSFD